MVLLGVLTTHSASEPRALAFMEEAGYGTVHLKSQDWGHRDRQNPDVHWPDSFAPSSSSFSERDYASQNKND